MRLPSHLLANLSLAGLAVTASCERAREPECKAAERPIVETDTRPLDEVVRRSQPQPAVAPRYAPLPQPQHKPSQPDPQPVVKKQPKPRRVWTSACGEPAHLVDADTKLVACGKG